MGQIEELVSSRDVEALIRLLAADDREVRIQAAQALGQMADPEAVPALAAAMGDEDYQVRQAAAAALVSIGPQAIPALRETLQGHGGRVTPYALWALGNIGSPAAMDALVGAASSPTWHVRWSAVESLGDVGGDRAIEALVNALGDRDERVRGAAYRSLEKIGLPALFQLAPALRDPAAPRREAARRLLGQMGTPEAEEALRREQLFRWIPVALLGAGVVLIALWLISKVVW